MNEPCAPRRMFVYGSLLEGFFNSDKALVGQITSRVPAKVKGILYHQPQKGYPAMVPGEGWVLGELLEFRDFASVIGPLDEIENYSGPGATNEYDRILTPVFSPDGEELEKAYVYWYGRSDLDTPENPVVPLPHGDWRRYMLVDSKR